MKAWVSFASNTALETENPRSIFYFPLEWGKVMPTFHYLWNKEKRSSEISQLSKNNLFWLHIGPHAFASQGVPFPVDAGVTLVPWCLVGPGEEPQARPGVCTGLGRHLINRSAVNWRTALCPALWNTGCCGQTEVYNEDCPQGICWHPGFMGGRLSKLRPLYKIWRVIS